MLIAQITDLHIVPPGALAYGRVDTAACLAQAVSYLAAASPRPDVVIATGDVTEAGQPVEYARLRALLAPLPMPVFAVPGNHDDRAAFRAAFAADGYLPAEGEFLHYTVDHLGPVRLIMLDSVVPGEPYGRLCRQRLAWLADRLAEQPDRPTVLALHHPPFRTGIGHMDAMMLQEPEPFADLVRAHPQIDRVLCGHLHRDIQVRWAGTIACTAPSVAHQVVLDLRPDGPADLVLEPPACFLHLYRPDTGIISHTAYTGDYDGPYPFFDDQAQVP